MTTQQAFAQAIQHHQAGRLKDAETLYRKILAVQPNHADALHLLGVIAHQAGRHDLAVEHIRRALVLAPNNPAAHSNLGEALRKTGRLDEALASYHRALQLKPDYVEAHCNLGATLAANGQPGEAIAAYHRALALRPDYPEAHYNLGNALRESGQLAAAIAAYRRALELKANYPEACNNLGNTLRTERRFDEAVAVFHRTLELMPNHPEAHNNLGSTLKDQGKFDDAILAFRRALELKPDSAEAQMNLGNALKDQGRLDEALSALRRAVELKPDYQKAHSNLIYTLHFHPSQNDRTIADEQGRWNRQFAEPLRKFRPPYTNDRQPERRLRIGYVSPDFREHVLGRYLAPLFQCHDHQNFEILCYSGVARPDMLTEAFRQWSDHWQSTVGVPDEMLAELIRRDRVDILVDLTQHLAGNRLPVFARQPAPVQVSFAGYPESTGLETIGYRISDRFLEGSTERRKEEGERRKEQVILIDSLWCYAPCGIEVDVHELPAAQCGRVTFGCLNNFCKINEPLLRLWARILGRVADARLVLLTSPGSHRQRTHEILQREGIEPHRLEFVETRPRRAYLELYHQIDIALDPFPYNGHSTSLDALWMGVPVVSLAGKSAVSRAGWSQLSNLGLPELTAFSDEEYLGIATGLAHDLPRLAELRRALRPRMEASPLMDAPRFARNMEAAYGAMWRQWCAKTSPGQ